MSLRGSVTRPGFIFGDIHAALAYASVGDDGALTALIEGLKGRADLLGKGVITTATLHAWVSERVKELTRGSQHPVMIVPPTQKDVFQDFPMFAAKK